MCYVSYHTPQAGLWARGDSYGDDLHSGTSRGKISDQPTRIFRPSFKKQDGSTIGFRNDRFCGNVNRFFCSDKSGTKNRCDYGCSRSRHSGRIRHMVHHTRGLSSPACGWNRNHYWELGAQTRYNRRASGRYRGGSAGWCKPGSVSNVYTKTSVRYGARTGNSSWRNKQACMDFDATKLIEKKSRGDHANH